MRKRISVILIHISAWLIYILLNYLFIKNYRVEFDVLFHAKTWIIQIVLFYLNYSILIPHLFFNKRLIIYLLTSLVALTSFYFIKSSFEDRYFRISKFPGEPPSGRREVFIHRYPEEGMEQRPKPDDQQFDKRKFEQRFEQKIGPIPPRRPFGPFNFLSVTGLLLIYTASFSIRLMQKWKDDEKLKDKIEKDKISTELNFLKQQINPHFLFNSLNSIYSLSMTKSPDTTEAILKLSTILRYILYEGEKQNVPLTDELEILKNYIDLQKLRITPKVKVNYIVEGEYQYLRIEPLLLLPLIANAFKHGVDNANESYIDIKITINKNELKALISNKKNKKTSVQYLNNQDDGGIGLKNIKRRLDLIYKGKYSLDINENENLFSVFLQINLR